MLVIVTVSVGVQNKPISKKAAQETKKPCVNRASSERLQCVVSRGRIMHIK